MKILLLSVMTIGSLWAVNATIVNGDVDVKITGQKVKHAKKGETFTLQEEQEICLVKKVGDGAVKIVYPTGFSIVLKKVSECEIVPIPVETKKVGWLMGMLVVIFQTSQDSSTDGVGSKGGDDEVITTDINLENAKRTTNYLYFGNPKWTLPLKLEILGKGVEAIKIKYKDGGFFVPVDILKVGQTLRVENIGIHYVFVYLLL